MRDILAKHQGNVQSNPRRKVTLHQHRNPLPVSSTPNPPTVRSASDLKSPAAAQHQSLILGRLIYMYAYASRPPPIVFVRSMVDVKDFGFPAVFERNL